MWTRTSHIDGELADLDGSAEKNLCQYLSYTVRFATHYISYTPGCHPFLPDQNENAPSPVSQDDLRDRNGTPNPCDFPR